MSHWPPSPTANLPLPPPLPADHTHGLVKREWQSGRKLRAAVSIDACQASSAARAHTGRCSLSGSAVEHAPWQASPMRNEKPCGKRMCVWLQLTRTERNAILNVWRGEQKCVGVGEGRWAAGQDRQTDNNRHTHTTTSYTRLLGGVRSESESCGLVVNPG